MDPNHLLRDCKRTYFSAVRCWKYNNINFGLELCDNLTKSLSRLNQLSPDEGSDDDGFASQVAQLRQLVWFLKIKCLAEEYYVNEAALSNEDDIDDDQVRVLSGSRLSGNINSTLGNNSSLIRTSGGISMVGTATNRRPMTGMITGRQTGAGGLSSRQGTTNTSYRPLTTSLTATQTTFSKSTRPLLRYSTQSLLAKPSFEYLYNAQTVTNKCPDYRQCLEYLNLVQNYLRKSLAHKVKSSNKKTKTNLTIKSVDEYDQEPLIDTRKDPRDGKSLCSPFWLLSYGICYYNIKMNKQAEEYFERVIEMNPKYLDAYLWLIKIYLRTNEPFKVLRICSIGLKHNKNALLYNWLARAQSVRGDLIEAHSTLLDSLRYFPINIEALANAGYFAFYGDRQEQALKCFSRIQQLPQNQISNCKTTQGSLASLVGVSCSQLLNNIALCNLYCGNYHQIMPLFNQALLNSPSKDITSDIWYNISFIPIHCGLTNLAISCLLLSLKNNSQNEEALNNLGVLKYSNMFVDSIDFPSYAESKMFESKNECENLDDFDLWTTQCDQAEIYFNPTSTNEHLLQPESLFNMAIIKLRRGHLLASARYCDLFLKQDPNNYQIKQVIREIKELVTHDY